MLDSLNFLDFLSHLGSSFPKATPDKRHRWEVPKIDFKIPPVSFSLLRGFLWSMSQCCITLIIKRSCGVGGKRSVYLQVWVERWVLFGDKAKYNQRCGDNSADIGQEIPDSGCLLEFQRGGYQTIGKLDINNKALEGFVPRIWIVVGFRGLCIESHFYYFGILCDLRSLKKLSHEICGIFHLVLVYEVPSAS